MRSHPFASLFDALDSLDSAIKERATRRAAADAIKQLQELSSAEEAGAISAAQKTAQTNLLSKQLALSLVESGQNPAAAAQLISIFSPKSQPLPMSFEAAAVEGALTKNPQLEKVGLEGLKQEQKNRLEQIRAAQESRGEQLEDRQKARSIAELSKKQKQWASESKEFDSLETKFNTLNTLASDPKNAFKFNSALTTYLQALGNSKVLSDYEQRLFRERFGIAEMTSDKLSEYFLGRVSSGKQEDFLAAAKDLKEALVASKQHRKSLYVGQLRVHPGFEHLTDEQLTAAIMPNEVSAQKSLPALSATPTLEDLRAYKQNIKKINGTYILTDPATGRSFPIGGLTDDIFKGL